MTRVELEIEGMTCDGCAAAVRRALSSVEGVREAEASFPEGRATVELDGRGDARGLVEAVERAGYRARVQTGAGTDAPGASGSAAPVRRGPGSEGRPPPAPATPATRETPAAVPGGNGGDGGDGGKGGDGGGPRHLLVIGGGSAAFAGAIRAAELGARVTLVERGTIGGTCVNVGCVPSKTLIRAAEVRHLREAHPFEGIPRGDGRTDLAALVAQKDELVARLRGAKYRDVLAAYPSVEYVEGEARFTGPRSAEVRLREGGSRKIEADRILVAVGAAPWVPPIPGLEAVPYWTSTEALAAEDLPGRLLVVGGSAVGTELAQMFARLGSRVTLFEALPTLVPNEDPELGEALARYLREEGIEVHAGAKVTGVSRTAGGEYRLRAEANGEEREFPGDRLLMATGRRSATAGLGLEAAGVETDARGFISVDAGMRTSGEGVYAAGDCTALPQFVYVAAKAGTVAAENAVGEGDREVDLSAMPAVTFTDPQVASVGLTEAGARERGEEVETRVLPLEHVPRALANRDTRGLVKLVARASDGRLLGVHVLSPAAGEVIQTAALAVLAGLAVSELAEALFPYLTEVEGLKLAAQTFEKRVEQLSCCAG